MPEPLAFLSALDAAREIGERRLGCADYTRALLQRIDAREAEVRAWEHLDPDQALAAARAIDEAITRADARGSLLGVPVAIKDIVDVRGMPTGDGTVLHAGRVATDDAALVRAMRRAGAWPIGKSVTTELATYTAGKTRNPHDAAHSPGGSSSGSAAAVACGMVPLAIGTQTNGSVIRPASFCGVVGFKPSYGRIARGGVLRQSPTLDQIGVFARSVDDAAALAEALFGPDPSDPATALAPMPPLAAIAAQTPPARLRLAWTRTPWWDRVAADAQAAFDEWIASLAGAVEAIELPDDARHAIGWHRTVMEADIAASYERDYDTGRLQLSASLQRQIERGRAITAVDYRKAIENRARVAASIDPFFERFDAIACPATLGTAPLASQGTGDPLMCTLWTYIGAPAISIPLLAGAHGLPLGVQLVARHGDDARLLRSAHALMSRRAGTIAE
ncbi:MAG: amidase [Burkholderiaceae bacterium]|nr:amidase [Burkholderiaceae bacterium]